MDFFQEIELDGKSAEAIARALFAIARVDGVHEREAGLIAAFWMDAGAGHGLLSDLEREETPITPEELAAILTTNQMRLLFAKSAILLTYADGKVTDAERAIMEKYSKALNLDDDTMKALEVSVKDYLLKHLAHLHNTDAVVEVSKKLDS
jgi:uncharacterized membrane protein YebE (DUF533 family)